MAYMNTVAETSIIGSTDYVNAKKSSECVILIQQVAHAPQADHWTAGTKVITAKPGQIQRGTAIATFDKSGHYPPNNDPLGHHAAIYISHDPKAQTINVLDQWKGSPPKPRTISFWGDITKSKGGRPYKRSNDSNTFYVIE